MTEETFAQALERRILLFDGAMGTEIQKHQPKPEDFPETRMASMMVFHKLAPN